MLKYIKHYSCIRRMDKFVQCAKVFVDREYISTKKELDNLKQRFNSPRVRLKNAAQWKTICNEALYCLEHDLGIYIDANLLDSNDDRIPMVLSQFEVVINDLLRICLNDIAKNDYWSTKMAKDISLAIRISLSAFGGGIGMLPMSFYTTRHTRGQVILNYVMCVITSTLWNTPSSIDSIPMIPCSSCRRDMPLTEVHIAGFCRTVGMCDECDRMHSATC